MPKEILEYVGTHYIKNDLKRLRKWRTLRWDIYNHYKMLMGKLTDDLLSSVFVSPLGDFITQIIIQRKTIQFYKIRIAISNPKIPAKKGARLIYGVIREDKKFVPILVYGAFEEGSFYKINKKKLLLRKSGLIKIIDEKLKTM